MLAKYELILFDAGGTLFRPFPSVGVIYERVFMKHGGRASADQLQDLFHEAWLKRDGLTGLASHASEKIEKEWWKHLVHEVFSQVQPVEDFEKFFEELYEVFGAPDCWRLFPETATVLKTLKEQGKKLGIVSNWDSRLFKLCDGLGLTPYFDFILASAVFGCAKPGSKIFQEALKRADTPAQSAIHIGDSLEDDIRGAERVGLDAILIDRKLTGQARDRTNFDRLKVIHDLQELLR